MRPCARGARARRPPEVIPVQGSGRGDADAPASATRIRRLVGPHPYRFAISCAMCPNHDAAGEVRAVAELILRPRRDQPGDVAWEVGHLYAGLPFGHRPALGSPGRCPDSPGSEIRAFRKAVGPSRTLYVRFAMSSAIRTNARRGDPRSYSRRVGPTSSLRSTRRCRLGSLRPRRPPS